jgi:hypothetical protein
MQALTKHYTTENAGMPKALAPPHRVVVLCQERQVGRNRGY